MPPLPMPRPTWKKIAKKLDLTPQQTRVVELVLRDQSDREIADRLQLTVATVRTHLARTFDRTGTARRLGLVLRIFAMVHGSSPEGKRG